ncbi:autoinducer binding domain-containing protein [Erwinia aphidicola]|uniref:autoinducer binding domain-containing protein n=1 Tax=Erwinia aphidicola TaxID=68334 RepID=UPI0030CC9901
MTPENYFSWRTEMQFAFSQVVSKADITRTIEQQMSHLGFDFYAFLFGTPFLLPGRKPFFTNYPQNWVEYYLQEDFAQLDPVLKICRAPGNVWPWDEMADAAGRKVFRAARKHGIYHGISCSMMAKNRSMGILSMSYACESKTIQLTTGLELQLQNLTELSLAALIEMDDISMTAAKLELSERELEIQKLTAEGKTSAEISLILSISKNTVNFHQKNMQKRFNAPNKTQIASYAAAIGLI